MEALVVALVVAEVVTTAQQRGAAPCRAGGQPSSASHGTATQSASVAVFHDRVVSLSARTVKHASASAAVYTRGGGGGRKVIASSVSFAPLSRTHLHTSRTALPWRQR